MVLFHYYKFLIHVHDREDNNSIKFNINYGLPLEHCIELGVTTSGHRTYLYHFL